MHNILISRDSKGKIRVVDISYCWSETLHSFIIIRKTSQLGGKVTEQPLIEVNAGKAKRTLAEQVELVYKSNVKKYLDKGYKDIKDFGYKTLEEFDPNKVFPQDVTDQNGFLKPMQCKSYNDVALSTFDKEHYCSRKLDGVRMMVKLQDGVPRTSSRGGGDYDIPATYILQDPFLVDFLKTYPDIVLDGELYIHGLPLPYISGLCRKITLEEKHKDLKYYIFDIAIPDVPFEDRLALLEEMQEVFENSDKIVICEHIKVNCWAAIDKLHDKFVSEGYEGCIIRNPNKDYGFGKRDNRMIKIKQFSEDEFEITGINEGLREEDFVFQLKAHNGKPFEAKPIGDRALKQEYRKNINNLIGKMGTVKFFGFTPYGTPNLPIFKNPRID